MAYSSVQVPNDKAAEFDAAAMDCFVNVDWEATTGDFWTTFNVWSVFPTPVSEAEVTRFVNMSEDFGGG